MIRQWLQSRISGVEKGFGRITERSGLFSTLKGNWIEAIYITGIVVMSAGAVSAFASPVPQTYPIYPSTSGESIEEMVIYSMAMLLGFGGLYLSYLSGRQTVRPRLVSIFLMVGLIMIAIAIYIEMYVFISK